MDEMNDQETSAEEPAAEPMRRSRGCGRFFGGLMSGAIVGGALALVLAPLRGEERARRHFESDPMGSREGLEAEGRLRAKVAVERLQAVAGGVTSSVTGAWATLRERLRDAVEEGKEGMAEGQEEARQRYEFMTKRRRPRR